MTKQINNKRASKREVRVNLATQKFEVRTNADGTRSISGYFAVFNSMSEDIGFREIIKPGAFKKSLRETNPDVLCYFNHNSDLLLGRVSSGTLEVSEDNKGLRFRCQLPDTSTANDLIALIERSDISACSFGMSVVQDSWQELDGQLIRTITEAIVYEGSPVISPAYTSTSVNLRSVPKALRSKLKRASDDDDSDDDSNCDPDDPDHDPEADCPDDEDRSDECECDCDACQAGDCDQCSNIGCDDDDCDDCPAQTRAAHLAILTRRLR